MKMNMRIIRMPIVLSLILVTAFLLLAAQGGIAESQIRLIVDGNDITAAAAPVIRNDRTLVPVRFVSEALAAQVDWYEQDRTVRITKDSRSVLLRIDSHLVEYSNPERVYNLCDAAPQIINDRTFVPLRLVSNALGVGIKWDDISRTVSIDSSETSGIMPFFDMKVLSIQPGQVITGQTDLQSAFPSQVPAGAAEIRYLLLDAETAKGVVIARGRQLAAAYQWIPELRQNGNRILVAAVYDSNGQFLAGDSVPVRVGIIPAVSLKGIEQGQTVGDSVSLSADLNFSADYVKYTIINLDDGKVYVSPETDPQGQFQWAPMMEDNGNVSIKVTAYDQEGTGHESQAVTVNAAVARKLALAGISAGKTIDGPVTLSVSRNFQVSETEYVMKDSQAGTETVLAKVGYVSFKWFPEPALKGSRELFVRVRDTQGVVFTSSGISVNLAGTPKLLVVGAGPQQVISGPVKLKVSSNVALDSIEYSLVNIKTGTRKVVPGNPDQSAESIYTPASGDDGAWQLQAEGIYEVTKKIKSEAVPITIYTGNTYAALPIIEKSRFLDMSSGLARESWERTGMSAALQTAQAILETGWGQSVPVDKYKGQLSYNLFGIKGTGPAGSVISNTWEEYNGVSYRIDAKFRAYHSADESWADHKRLLLTADRYQIFRDVMHDSTQGAWALKRAGYATDSKYPLKLLNIIKQYDLQKLDQTGI